MRTVFATSASRLQVWYAKAYSLFVHTEGQNIPADEASRTSSSANLMDLDRRIRQAEQELATIRKQLKTTARGRGALAESLADLENEILELRKELSARKGI
jgi:septal ring factor EnvC (AmiA/AmiB activator)